MVESVQGGLRQRKAERTRAALLSAAISLFQKRGYAAATVNEICSAAEISLGTFYKYFDSKQAILIAFLKEDRQNAELKVQARLDGPIDDPIDYIYESVLPNLLIRGDKANFALWREILAALILTSTEKLSVKELNESRLVYRGHSLSALKRLRNEGLLIRVAPVEDLADALYSILSFQFQEYVCRRYKNADEYRAKLRALIQIAIRPWLAV